MYKNRSKLHKLYSLAVSPNRRFRSIHRSFSDVEDEVMTILEEETAELGRDTQEFIIGTIELEKAWLESLNLADLSYINKLDKYLSSSKKYYSFGSYLKNIWSSIKSFITKAARKAKKAADILIFEPLKILFYRPFPYFTDVEDIAKGAETFIDNVKKRIIEAQKEYRNNYEYIAQNVENPISPDEFEKRTTLIIHLLLKAKTHIKPAYKTYHKLIIIRSILVTAITCAYAYKIFTWNMGDVHLETAKQIFEHIEALLYDIYSSGLISSFVLIGLLNIAARFLVLPLTLGADEIFHKKVFKDLHHDLIVDMNADLIKLLIAMNDKDYNEAAKQMQLISEKIKLVESGKPSKYGDSPLLMID